MKLGPFFSYLGLLILFPFIVVVQGFYVWLDIWNEVA